MRIAPTKDVEWSMTFYYPMDVSLWVILYKEFLN
jgi:hypothetical protein